MKQMKNNEQIVVENNSHSSSETDNLLHNQATENRNRIGLPGKKTGEIIFYEYSNIIRCEYDKGYTTFIIKESNRILQIMSSKSMKYYEKRLPMGQFLRTHYKHMVNKTLITKLFKGKYAHFVMCDGKTVPIARNRKPKVLQVLPEF